MATTMNQCQSLLQYPLHHQRYLPLEEQLEETQELEEIEAKEYKMMMVFWTTLALLLETVNRPVLPVLNTLGLFSLPSYIRHKPVACNLTQKCLA